MSRAEKSASAERSGHEAELSVYQRAMRERLLAAPSVPGPWRSVGLVPVGGLLGIGFAAHPDSGRDLVMVVSHDGHGLFDAVTGEKTARDRDPEPDGSTPDEAADLSCPGLGPINGCRVRSVVP
ncbi:hypothetical protein BZZ08_03263 [Streptomyces sp. MH60]|nr:hypothetical protein BZZ08_03263 [Streptomyces sp. MH60]